VAIIFISHTGILINITVSYVLYQYFNSIVAHFNRR